MTETMEKYHVSLCHTSIDVNTSQARNIRSQHRLRDALQHSLWSNRIQRDLLGSNGIQWDLVGSSGIRWHLMGFTRIHGIYWDLVGTGIREPLFPPWNTFCWSSCMVSICNYVLINRICQSFNIYLKVAFNLNFYKITFFNIRMRQ